MAKGGDGKPGNGGEPSMMQTVIAVALLTLIGGGGGAFLGFTLSAPAPAGPAKAPAQTLESTEHGDAVADPHKKSAGHGGDEKKAAEPDVLEVKELPPIVTNLGEPESSWIRLQAAIVYDPKEMQHAEKLIAELMADVTAFLRTATMSSLEGAEGLRRLQEELTERAAIRSERRVREFIIETMVVQ